MKWKVAILTSALVFLAAGASHAQEVLRGFDFLETKPNQTAEDLSDLSSLCPGAQIFGNPIVPLRGIPLEMISQCPGADLGNTDAHLGNTDTAIQRLQNTMGLDFQPSPVPIEIVGLHLQSVQPFVVIYNGEPQEWMLDVTLPPIQGQPIGTMIIQKTNPNGGTFDSQLFVQPRFTFTKVTPCPAEVVCVVDPVQPMEFRALNTPWSYMPPPGEPLLEVRGCTSNFFPGVMPAPNLAEPGRSLLQAFNEQALLAQHGVIPPPPPKLHQHDWQMAVHFEFWLQNISQEMTINDFRIKNARYVPMDPPGSLHDSTVIIKSTSICDPRPFCPLQPPDRWTRVNWDSLSPNYKKEAWWAFPPVPPQGMAPPMDIVFSIPCGVRPGTGAWYEVDYECTINCIVVDSGTFRFHCPPEPPCTTQVGCKDIGTVVDVPPKSRAGRIQILEQNYPNPFNPRTTIDFTLERETNVVLKIYDSQGRAVRTLVNDRRMAGTHRVGWDATDDSGRILPAGAYFYEIDVAGVRQAKKMVMIK